MNKSPCRLYLSVPICHPPEELVLRLDKILSDNDVAAVLFSPQNRNGVEDAKALKHCAHNHGSAFIVADDIELARNINADGLHLSNTVKTYDQARSEVGTDWIIGASSPLNRHDAMCIGESGVDYIWFAPGNADGHQSESERVLEDLIGWWSELFEVPCVASAYADVNQNRCLIEAGADFLSIGHTIWNSVQDPEHYLNALSRLIAQCGREK